MGVIKVTVECYGDKYVLETSGESDIDGMVDVMKKMLYCMGFHNDTIEGVLGEEIQDKADEETVEDNQRGVEADAA